MVEVDYLLFNSWIFVSIQPQPNWRKSKEELERLGRITPKSKHFVKKTVHKFSSIVNLFLIRESPKKIVTQEIDYFKQNHSSDSGMKTTFYT